MEVYRGKPIYHGLGNFVTVTRALAIAPAWNATTGPASAANISASSPTRKRPTCRGTLKARNTMIASLTFDNDLRFARRSHSMPDHKIGEPEPLGNDVQGQQVLAYIEHITQQGRLNARYRWQETK